MARHIGDYGWNNDQHLSFETSVFGSILTDRHARFTETSVDTCRLRVVLVFRFLAGITGLIDRNAPRTEIDGDAPK